MGLYNILKKTSDVKILTLYNEQRGSILDNPDFIYLNRYKNTFRKFLAEKRSYLTYQLLKIRRKIFPAKSRKYKTLNTDWLLLNRAMDNELKKWPGCSIIAVDTGPALFCQLTNRSYHFLSTELQTERIEETKLLNSKFILSIIIQTKRRLALLAIPGQDQIKNVFFIQNAPDFKPPVKRSRPSGKLIFGGAIWEGFGFQYCLELIRKYKQFSLTLKGTAQCDIEHYKKEYAAEIAAGRLVVDNSYSGADEFNDLLLEHSIGFSFYDLHHPEIRKSREHYETAPSGKMFTYFGLGIPVIGSAGLSEISEFEAGVTLSDYSPDSLFAAVEKILADYSRYSDNALKAAAHFSFTEMARPFADFIQKQS
ncbi:MAG: hypothetical protein U0U70_04105 [Chitinophagaceae bacterium]